MPRVPSPWCPISPTTMKRKLTLAILTLVAASASAQLIKNGFYRIKNYGSNRYAYVYDSSGSVNLANYSADMGAIYLHNDANRRLSDPASVVYGSSHGTYSKDGKAYELYDLQSQGTGINQIIKYYITVQTGVYPGTYWVFQPNYNMYLWDGVSTTYYPNSYITTTSGTKNQYRCWNIYPVDSSTDEYLGIAPNANMKAGSKYYKPYYLGFAMDFLSSGMKAYYVKDVKSDAVIIKELIGTIPAATPIIVECSSAEATNNRVNLQYKNIAAITDNKLTGNYFCYENHGPTAYSLYDANTMRVLAVKNGKLHYVVDTNHEHTTLLTIEKKSNYYLNANESYLKVPAGSPAELPVMTEAEYEALHPSAKKGDINGDGLTNSTDVALLYRYIAAGKKASEVPAADVNKDGLINSTDVALLYRVIAAGQ